MSAPRTLNSITPYNAVLAGEYCSSRLWQACQRTHRRGHSECRHYRANGRATETRSIDFDHARHRVDRRGQFALAQYKGTGTINGSAAIISCSQLAMALSWAGTSRMASVSRLYRPEHQRRDLRQPDVNGLQHDLWQYRTARRRQYCHPYQVGHEMKSSIARWRERLYG